MSGTITHVKDLEKDGTASVWSYLIGLQGEGKQRYSPVFKVSRAKWRLLIQAVNKDFGVYVECQGCDVEPNEKWEVVAHFQLETIQRSGEPGIVNWARHTFTSKTPSLGFSTQIPIKTVTDTKNTYILEDSKGRPHVEIRVTIKDHRLMSTPSPLYQGIKNQGATCYLNSLLQTLFHLNQFRSATYALANSSISYPTDLKKTIPYCLARLFYHLERGTTPASSLALTDSFGWGRADAFEQHDVQELARKLIDTLETKMKETSLSGVMKGLFLGRGRNYVKCVNVDFQSSREEEFYDIQLCVRGCGGIHGSFRKELKQEFLTGDNAYHAFDEHTGMNSMQEAKKGMEWLSFPPVLFLHLRRFEYDYTTDGFVKVADRFEFSEDLDLRPYWQTETSKVGHQGAFPTVQEVDCKYKLHAVLVHSGTVVGGHYYAFAQLGGKWYKFDDTVVTEATQDEAVGENFGGNEGDERFWLNNKSSGSSTSAYMLVYVKASAVDEICGQKTVIPTPLLEEFKKDDEEQRERQKEREEAYLYYTLHITTEEDFREYDEESSYLHADLKKKKWLSPNPLKVLKTWTYGDMLKVVNRHLNKDEDARTRLWVWCERNNDTERPWGPLVTLNTYDPPCRLVTSGTPIEGIFKGVNSAEVVHLHADEGPPLKSNEILLFVKSYDPLTATLAYAGSIAISASKRVHDLAIKINKMVGNPSATQLSLWEESRKSLIIPLDRQTPLQEYELGTGDIIIYYKAQEGVSPEVKQPPDAFLYMLTRKTVRIVELNKQKDTTAVEMCSHYTYADIVSTIAEAVHVPSTHIRLHYLGRALKENDHLELTLDQLLTYNDIVEYEALSMPVRDLLMNLEVPIKHYNKVVLVKQLKLIMRNEATAGQALGEISKCLNEGAANSNGNGTTNGSCSNNGAGDVVDPLQLRLVKVRRKRIEAVLGHTDYLRFHVCQDVSFASDKVADQPTNSTTVSVCHVERQWAGHHVLNMHSTPFLSYICPGETATDLLTRLAKVMNVTKEARIKGWKLLLINVQQGREVALCSLEDDALPCIQEALQKNHIREPLDVFKQNFPLTVHIGIEHRDEGRRTGEKGVEIKGI